ncbi:MAG: nucleotide sugar dehydrogenase [Caldilineaceae bacterium]|nr:nucleotide sugar dehydrogenase [Caldilineaceae bacterium]
MKETMITKFEQRNAHVAVIGLGYVGLPLAVQFAQAGYRVTGIDLDQRKVEAINRGESYIGDISSETLAAVTGQRAAIFHATSNGSTTSVDTPAAAIAQAAVPTTQTQAGILRATADYSVLAECDAVSICVPTPLNKTGDPDISYIYSATEQIAQYLHRGMAIVLESTTYPGTTTEVVLPRLLENDRALQIGKDFFLAFSPERVDPGRTDWLTHNTPKVIGGVTPECLAVAIAYYSAAIETLVPVSSPNAAEMVKLFENTFRSVNIGLANEMLLMCDKLGLDAWEVIDAAATKPFGFMRFTPGPGLGGHCIPIDPHYLSWKLRTLAYNARFIELASEINTGMPRYWVQQVQDALNDAGRAVKGSRILVLGVAYKKNVNDMRESPALDIIHLLEEKGAHVYYHDPHVPSFQHEGMEMVSVTDLHVALSMVDCVVVATDHDVYDWDEIRHKAALVVDTRHVI